MDLELSQAEIDALISCGKDITDPPRRETRLSRGHRRNEMLLRSREGGEEFQLFIRENERFPENFSVGLNYLPAGGGKPFPLVRCNGAHGDFNRARSGNPHCQYHVHTVSAQLIAEGKDPLGNASPTSAYASLIGAVRYLCQLAGVSGYELHFPEHVQAPLWTEPLLERLQ